MKTGMLSRSRFFGLKQRISMYFVLTMNTDSLLRQPFFGPKVSLISETYRSAIEWKWHLFFDTNQSSYFWFPLAGVTLFCSSHMMSLRLGPALPGTALLLFLLPVWELGDGPCCWPLRLLESSWGLRGDLATLHKLMGPGDVFWS